jgi:hypothetical protein
VESEREECVVADPALRTVVVDDTLSSRFILSLLHLGLHPSGAVSKSVFTHLATMCACLLSSRLDSLQNQRFAAL